MGGEGALEILEFGLEDFRGCRDVEVMVCRVVGNIPGSVEDGAEDLVWETLDADA